MTRPRSVVEFRPDVPPFYVEQGFGTLTGTDGDFFSTPDNAALDIVGDLDARIEVTLADWTPSTARPLIAKWNTTGNQRSWMFYLDPSGLLGFTWSTNGTATLTATSTEAPEVPFSGRLAVRAVLDVDTGGGSYSVAFYTASVVGGPWVQMGEPVEAGPVTSIFASTAVLEIGTHNSGTPTGSFDPLSGTVWAAQVRSVIDGTIVANPDFDDHATGTTSFVDSAGRTWSKQGNASIDDGAIDWIRLSAGGPHGNRVRHVEWQWGKQADDEEWPAGEGTVELYNHDRLFDPNNSSGTYFGQLNPRVQFRVRSSSIALDLPGAAGATASTPDHASFATADLDVRVHLAMDSWAPGGFGQFICGQWPNVGGNNGWHLAAAATGELSFVFTTNGTTNLTRASTVATGFAAGSDHWVRFTLDADDGAGNHDVTFYTSTDGVTWTQLGAVVQTAGTVTRFNSTAVLAVGDILPLAGQVRQVVLLDGIGGAAVANPDFEAQQVGDTSFTDSTGKTWTVNGTAAIAFDDSYLWDQFYGFVEDGWEQTYKHPVDGYCTVRLVDAFAILEGYTLPAVFDAAVLSFGPKHFYRLDVASGSEAVGDIAGDLDGTVIGPPDFTTDALYPAIPGSAEFNATANTDRIDLSRSPVLIDPFHATVVAVFRTDVPAEASTIHSIFWQGDGNGSDTDAVVLFVDTDGTIAFEYIVNGSGFLFKADAVDDGEPHIVFGQSNTGSALDFGVALDSATLDQTGPAPGALAAAQGAAIGGPANAAAGFTNDYFEGDIAAVALYAGVLTSGARQAIIDALDGLSGQRSDQQIRWAFNTIGVADDFLSLDEGRAIMGAANTGGRNALEWCRDVQRTEQGALYVDHRDAGKIRLRERFADWLHTRSVDVQATFSDDPAATGVLRVEPDSLVVEPNGVRTIVNRWSVTWSGGEETFEDPESRFNYGPRGDTLDIQSPSPTIARGLAQYRLAQTKDPQTRVHGLGIDPAAAEDGFASALQLRVGDRVRYRSQPSSTGSVTSIDLRVLGVNHDVDGMGWTVDYFVDAAPDTQVQLFTLGTSQLDGPDILAA